MAIDKKAILDAVYQGAGQPAKNLIPPTMWSYNNAVQDFPYDPERAKKLLAEAGFPDGFETDLWAMPVQRPYNPDARRIAELMQADLAKVGIKASIVSYEWGEYRKRAQAGEHQMAQLGWTGDNGDPDNFFVPLASCAASRPGGGSISKWCNQQFDALVNTAATLTDQAERAKLYEQAQAIMHEEAPFYLIAHSVVFMPMRKEVERVQDESLRSPPVRPGDPEVRRCKRNRSGRAVRVPSDSDTGRGVAVAYRLSWRRCRSSRSWRCSACSAGRLGRRRWPGWSSA